MKKPIENGCTPIALALVVCDCIHRDQTTGKYTIVGTFNGLICPKYPWEVDQIAVYAAVTEAIGAYTLKIQIVDADERNAPVAELEMDLDPKDPREVHELGAVLGGFTLPKPGEYRIQLVVGSEVILERKFMASSINFETEGDDYEQI